MQVTTMIYTAVAVASMLPIGAWLAFLWSERRWREHERWLASRVPPVVAHTPPQRGEEALPTIPTHYRPSHEALWEDEPGLRPSVRERMPLSTAGQRASHPPPPPWHQAFEGEAPPELDGASVHEENDEMKWTQVAATAALSVGLVAGCHRDETPAEGTYKRNPHPRERYELTVTVANAPGPFGGITASATYKAPNCHYVISKFNGITGDPHDFQMVDVVKTAENEWKATFYADQMLDEDYGLGEGVCRWEMTGAHAALRASDSPTSGETSYVVDLRAKDVLAERSVTTYFNKRSYPRDEAISDYLAPGFTDRSRFRHPLTDADLFTITLNARKVSP